MNAETKTRQPQVNSSENGINSILRQPTWVMPDYVYNADERERKAWLSYVQVIDEELDEHGSRNPDYVRLREAKEIWQKAADAQTAARIKWEKVRYL